MSQDKKYSLWSLLNKYDKIEIPIIQRDYAQGRESKEVNKIRKDFVDYLTDNLVDEHAIELDFVYGMEKDGLFIPLDGQQRLTTLFLLHWYVAYKEGHLNDHKDTLLKFTYETRASSHAFMVCLCNQKHPNVQSIVSYIKEKAYWFDNEWMLDPSVSGMLTMIHAIETNERLNMNLGNLFERLTSDKLLISFYFLPLKEFGLSDDLYIRMNARGKILNEFENFKSNFYRIIKEYPEINRIKDKMEYEWVSNLWEYRKIPDNEFVVDTYFMNYLEFITQMLYYHHYSDSREKANLSFRDLDTFKLIYKSEEHIRFLEFCFDLIPVLRSFMPEKQWLWSSETSLSGIIQKCMNKGCKIEISEKFILYGSLLFCYQNGGKTAEMEGFIRVLRNLIHNTDDNSEREWRKIINSTERLIFDNTESGMNIFRHLTEHELSLEGFAVPQKNEETLKAILWKSKGNDFMKIIERAENNKYLQGRVLPLIKCSYSDDENEINNKNTGNINAVEIDSNVLDGIITAYEEICKDDFNPIFGDLINTSLYKYQRQYTYVPSSIDLCRCIYNYDYAHHSSTVLLAKQLWKSGRTLNSFLDVIEAEFISKIDDICEVSDMKTQLYILYIVTKKVYGWKYTEFFRNGFNFGCTDDESYSKIYKPFYKIADTVINKPVFQTYVSQFQYNRGVLDQRIPSVYWEKYDSYIPKVKEWASSVLTDCQNNELG